uniref:RING-type domain-containing protein n=1 Tax=Clastoptera arizonana TaxID=38151 RepID=A0A1B6D5D3_9HEMI
MHLACVICSDLFTGADPETIYATSCGHLFHYACLLEWFERSKSCPQCRHKQSEKNITRIYFSLPSNLAPDVDVTTLQYKIDSLNYQLKCKDVDIKNLKEAKGLLEKQNKGLREEIRKKKEEEQTNTSQLFALKETISHLKKECKKLNESKLEAEYLRNKIENYERQVINNGNYNSLLKWSFSSTMLI